MKWTLLDSVALFQGFFRMEEHQYRIERFDGGEMTLSREVLVRANAAGVLPYDPATDQVVLVEQFRQGAILRDASPWMLEIVAGMVEPGENAAEVVEREAVEEAGCTVSSLLEVAHYFPSPGCATEEMTIFVGLCDATTVQVTGGLEHEQEDIRVHVISRKAFLNSLIEGRLDNAATIMAAQWFLLHFDAWRESGFKDTFKPDPIE